MTHRYVLLFILLAFTANNCVAQPNVNQPSNVEICNGVSTGVVNFTGSMPGTIFNWTNDNTSIGLAASGSGNISSFTATNASDTAVTANITVTPIIPASTTYNYTGTIQTWTVATTGTYTIKVAGAQGGDALPWIGGKGAELTGDFSLNAGDVISILVGEKGKSINNGTCFQGGGGGGGTFVKRNGTLIMAAGGGGGAGRGENGTTGNSNATNNFGVFGFNGNPGIITTTGNVANGSWSSAGSNGTPGINGNGGTGGNYYAGGGGAGYLTNGGSSTNGALAGGGKAYVNGGAGGTVTSPFCTSLTNGGFGGGGAAIFGGGGGGGYSGGAGGQHGANWSGTGGGGGGSYNTGANQTNTADIQTGNGVCVITENTVTNGTPKTFTIKVKPTPTVNTVTNLSVCNGVNTAVINFTGTVSSTNYNWTNNSTSIGLGATGTGDINAFAAINTGDMPVTVTIAVTPNANGCSGSSKTFDITVKPSPTVGTTLDQSVCNGAGTTAITFTGAVNGTAFNWTNNTTSIGLAAMGSGNIGAFTTSNAGTTPVISTIIVTPAADGCSGSADTFDIVVKPTPTINAVANQSICNGINTAAVTFTGAISGTTYSWANNITSIGLGANGTGNINAFTAANTGTTPVTATIIVTSTANNCPGSADTFDITVKPTPTLGATADQSVCNGANTTAISFTGAVSGTVYNWTNNAISTGLNASGTGDISTFTTNNTGVTPVTSTIIVTPTANGCSGSADTFDITVKPTPTVSTVANQSICNGANTAAVTFTGAVNGTGYSWTNNTTSVGLGAAGTGNINAFTAANTGTTPVSATITVMPTANNCPGSSKTFDITVKPTPNVNTISNQSVCNGTSTASVNFTGAVSGTVYSWTNNTASVGLAGSGSGNIGAFTAGNSGTTPVTATVTVTPTANSCLGSQKAFDIVVKPTPTVNSVSNQSICNASNTAAVNFTGAVSGSSYSWSNNTTSVGLGASGAGDISSFAAANAGVNPVTATITVTPTANGCSGNSKTFDITVKPTPTVNAISNQTVCNNASTVAVTFAGTVTGTSYNWTNNTPSIGLAGSGTGNIASFSAVNSGNTPVTGTITVTPTANSCTGLLKTFNIVVNPTPVVNSITDQTLCNGANTSAINFTGATSGTSYTWTNSTPGIGLAASGSGNITSFVATNTGTSPLLATIIVTPTANSCIGLSKTFVITVNPTLVPTVNIAGNAPGDSICASTNVIFTATAVNQGTLPVYQWKKNGLNVGNNALIYSDNILKNGDIITCSLTSNATCPSSSIVGSNSISMIVNMYVYHSIVVTSDAEGDTVCSGNGVLFTSAITNGGSAPIYQWKKNGVSVGSNSNRYTDYNINSGDQVVCSLTTNIHCPATTPVINSNMVKMTLLPNVNVTATITGTPVSDGVLFHSQVTNGGSQMTYQWMKNDVPIPGAIHDSLFIKNINMTDDIKLKVDHNIRCTPTDIVTSNSLTKMQVTGISDVTLPANFALYPNPNMGQFTIKGDFDRYTQMTLEVINTLGQVIYKEAISTNLQGNEKQINIGDIPSGMYILNIKSENEIVPLRFTLSK